MLGEAMVQKESWRMRAESLTSPSEAWVNKENLQGNLGSLAHPVVGGDHEGGPVESYVEGCSVVGGWLGVIVGYQC